MLRFQIIAKVIKNISARKIQGSALYISVMLSIVIGILLLCFILIANYNQRQVTIFGQLSQLHCNLRSAFQLARSAYFTSEQNARWIRNTINDDSIRVKKLYWGAYLVISAETKNRHQYLAESGLFGTYMTADTGLLIADNSRPVGLSGNIKFSSTCYLPRAGAKPAYIEGQSYISNAQNAFYTKPSPPAIPEIDGNILSGLKQQIHTSNIFRDSSVTELPLICSQPFSSKTIAWRFVYPSLKGFHLSNNIKLLGDEIEIGNDAVLDNILIICKKARFKKGFRGKVHVIATDSISMEEDCEFYFPSSLTLLAGDKTETGFYSIQFNKNCKFFGGVIAVSENSSSAQKVFIKLHPGAEINGLVYSANYLHLEGRLHATVIAGKLLLKTPSAVYENHMLGCEIDPGKYAGAIAVPLLFKHNSSLVCCEKVI